MKTSTNKFPATLLVTLFFGMLSCTNLDDRVLDRPTDVNLTGGGANAASLLNGVYSQLNSFTNQANAYAMMEHSTDEMMGPTRGTDWDDFGTWRRLHQHTWDAAHNQVNDAWNDLNIGVFRATETIAAAGPNTELAAQARFLRAFFMFYVVDLYGQVPLREANASFDAIPRVLSRAEATDFIVEDLRFAIQNLRPGVPGRANIDAARFLLAKVHLNKAVFTQNPQQPAGPYTFAPADMNAVIENCDAIISSGRYQLEPAGEYFDNFHWDNSTLSKELVFVIPNEKGAPVGNVQNRFRMTMHYRQQPDGWNGFTTLADFYNSFEAQDERRGKEVMGMTDKLGLRAGFLVGQQRGPVEKKLPDGTVTSEIANLQDRGGSPLVFTPDLNILYSNESNGIRVIKYLPEPGNFGNQGTDYVFFRYSDVLLMKAEAIARGGTPTGGATALSLVNTLRAARGATAASSVALPALLAERGRELYWEGWRRNDLIRFESFLRPFDQKPGQSEPFRVVYPVPQRAVDTNPNLKQNFGY